MTEIAKPAAPPVASLWHRMSTRNRGTKIVGPETGNKMLGLPDGWPQPALPLWRRVEYRDKLALPSWHEWTLTTGKVAASGFTPKWQGADFDTRDPENHMYGNKYHSLNDPALWRFCHAKSRRKILLHQGLITPDGKVIVSLKDYNQWRRDLFRQQLQLRNRKLKMTDRNVLCGSIKGFIAAIYSPNGQAAAVDEPKEEEKDGKKPAKIRQKKRSGVSEHLKVGPTNQFDITDEMAGPRFDSKQETDALLVELIRLHGFTQQIRSEIGIYNHLTIAAQHAIKVKHAHDHLQAKIQAQDAAAVKRKLHLTSVVRGDIKKTKAERALKRRITYQTVMEKLDQSMFENEAKQSALRVETWKNYFCRKHRGSEPVVPSGRSYDPRYRSKLIQDQEERRKRSLVDRKGEHPHKDLHAHEKNPKHIKVHGHPHPEKSGHNDSHWHGYATHDQPRDMVRSYEEHPHKDLHAHERDPVHIRVHGHPHPERSGHNDSHWTGYAGPPRTLTTLAPATASSHIDAPSSESLSDKPSALGHIHHRSRPDEVPSDENAVKLLIPAGPARGAKTASSHLDVQSMESLSDKPSQLGHSRQHHLDRPFSPQEQSSRENLLTFRKAKPDQSPAGQLKVEASDASLAEKSSTLGHSHPWQHSLPGPAEVASQSSFEYSAEEKDQGHESSEERKTLRPLKSALSKPGGRAESQHMKITFAPEVADDPDFPTAKRSSEVLLDANVPPARDILARSADPGIDQRDSIPVHVPLRAAVSMTSMPNLAVSTVSDITDEKAPEYHPHYITADDIHRRRPHTPPGKTRPRKPRGQTPEPEPKRVQRLGKPTGAKPVARAESSHRKKEKEASLDEAGIEAMAMHMFAEIDDDHHISAGAHHTKHNRSPSPFAMQEQPDYDSPGEAMPKPNIEIMLPAVEKSESNSEQLEAVDIINEIHEAASSVLPSKSNSASDLPRDGPKQEPAPQPQEATPEQTPIAVPEAAAPQEYPPEPPAEIKPVSLEADTAEIKAESPSPAPETVVEAKPEEQKPLEQTEQLAPVDVTPSAPPAEKSSKLDQALAEASINPGSPTETPETPRADPAPTAEQEAKTAE